MVSPWNGSPNITIEDFSLEGSDEGDDDDNLAYRKLLVRSGVISKFNEFVGMMQ